MKWPFSITETILVVAGAIVFRICIQDNEIYMLTCLLYGLLLGILRNALEDEDQ